MILRKNIYKKWDELDEMDFLNKYLYTFDLNAGLPDDLLIKMDRASMAHSVEARSPFLDYRMFEFSSSLPVDWKINGITTKWFLKKAMRDKIPKSILNKRKTGFGIPIRSWMIGSLGDSFWETILSKEALERGYFNRKSLIELRDRHKKNIVDASYFIYNLYFLELWHQNFIDSEI